MNFPHKCTRCGYCCLSENCQIAMTTFNIPKKGVVCPALSFTDDVASCKFAEHMNERNKDAMGFDKGCCISGRVFSGGTVTDFASISADRKIIATRILRKIKGIE